MADPLFAPDEQLDPAEAVVFEALYALGCSAACDPYDGDDCASVAVHAVRSLRAAGLLPLDAGVRTEYGCAYAGQPEPNIGPDRATAQRWVSFANSHGVPAVLVSRTITTSPWAEVDDPPIQPFKILPALKAMQP